LINSIDRFGVGEDWKRAFDWQFDALLALLCFKTPTEMITVTLIPRVAKLLYKRKTGYSTWG
jgi:hypothetical protein